MRWIVICFLILLANPLLGLVRIFGPRVLLQRRGQRVNGTIVRVDFDNRQESYVPTVRYMTKQGEEYEFRPRRFSGAAFQSALHQEVVVYYDPRHPQSAMFLHAEYAILQRFLFRAVCILLGCTLLFLFIAIFFPTLFPW
jgi:Protein of unknown function (DUF3592)